MSIHEEFEEEEGGRRGRRKWKDKMMSRIRREKVDRKWGEVAVKAVKGNTRRTGRENGERGEKKKRWSAIPS